MHVFFEEVVDHSVIQGVIAKIKAPLLSFKTLEKVQQGSMSVFINLITSSTGVCKGIRSHMAVKSAIYLASIVETTISV